MAVAKTKKTGSAPGVSEDMHTREKLLVATKQMLLEKGHSKTTVKEIAREAGVNHGLVHHYFHSKEQLFAELLTREFNVFDEGLEALTDVKDAMKYLSIHLFPNIKLYVEFHSLAQEMPTVKKLLAQSLRKRRKVTAKKFGFKDELMNSVLLAAFTGLVLHSSLDKSFPLKKTTERLLEMYNELSDKPI